jgi:polar amino acid transport system substrate-binding protein
VEVVKRFFGAVMAIALLGTLAPGVGSADLETIARRGKLIVAVKNNLPPLGFVDERGNLQGFEIDIARRLAEEILGSSEAIELRPVSNAERLQMVIDDRVDLAIARVTITPARARVVDFSRFYHLDSTGFLVRDGGIRGIEGLKKARIGVLNGSSTIAVLRSELPQARLIGVNSYQAAIKRLNTGEIDAFAADNSVLSGLSLANPAYHRLPVQLQLTALGVVLPRGLQYQSLRERVNGAIERLRDSGWLEERARYWGLKGDR